VIYKSSRSLTKQVDQGEKNCSSYTDTYLSANTRYPVRNKVQYTQYSNQFSDWQGSHPALRMYAIFHIPQLSFRQTVHGLHLQLLHS
jgi:hypothetical protein